MTEKQGLFARIFGLGGASKPAVAAEEHNGFAIYPEPVKEGTQWRIAARIEKEVDGEVKVHRLIRADTLESEEAARAASVGKAKQVIDEQGERIF